MTRFNLCFFIALFSILLGATSVCAQQAIAFPEGPINANPDAAMVPAEVVKVDKDKDAIVTLSYENDIFAGGDNNYTNGVRISYFSPEDDVPKLLSNAAGLVPFYPDQGRSRWGFAIGQSMYSPDNITLVNPPVDDQPYAGWLYGTATLITDTGKTLDTFQVTAGVVGPASGAEGVQRFIHKMIDSPKPRGWNYQLKNEPGLVLGYQRKWRNLYQLSPTGLGFDLSPSVGANLGNVFTNAGVGMLARIGYDLPSDYGPPLIQPSLGGSDFFMPVEKFGWYVFGGLEGNAVARNIFLDGNTFTDSRSVDKKPLVGGAQLGIAFTFPTARVAYTHVFRTDEFDTQRKPNQYGALTVSFRF